MENTVETVESTINELIKMFEKVDNETLEDIIRISQGILNKRKEHKLIIE